MATYTTRSSPTYLSYVNVCSITSTGTASNRGEVVVCCCDARYCPIAELPPAELFIYDTRQQCTPGFHKHDHSFRCRSNSSSTVVNHRTGVLRQQHMIYSSHTFSATCCITTVAPEELLFPTHTHVLISCLYKRCL